MSQYEGIWQELKTNKTVSLTANRFFHARIVKATIKRKGLDLGYKMQLADRNMYAVLEHTTRESIITFTLKIREIKKSIKGRIITLKDL